MSTEQRSTMPGPDRSITTAEVVDLMERDEAPVHTATSLAEDLDVSRPVVVDRLEEAKTDFARVEELQVGNTTAFHVADEDPREASEIHRDKILGWIEDRFVGLRSAPWTAVNPRAGPAEAGDKLQVEVIGVPGNWRIWDKFRWPNRREGPSREPTEDETSALVSGELYSRPTTPIEHIDYPNDYDLESKLGVREFQTEDGRKTLVATGEKRYLIKPSNDAVFLTDPEIDWISPVGEGAGGVHGDVV